MFRRKALTELTGWKAKSVKKPMIIRGSRQVGKSTLVSELGKQYELYIYLNLEKDSDAAFFRDSDEVKTILEKILLAKNLQLVPKHTLLFIDEIQEVPKAISLLRYFYEELQDVDVIAAGSLLEFALGELQSFPVGRVEQLSLYPMDFEEFLEALEENVALEYYQQMPIPDLAHDALLHLYHAYMLVGGMPEVVKVYVENDRNINALQAVYSSIWDSYVADIEKYSNNNTERRVLRHILSTAPSVRDRITFYGFGNSSYKSREVGEAFRKLHQAGLIRLIYPSSDTQLPLTLNYRRKPKLQFLDTGLLNYAANIQALLIDIKDMNSLYKGYLTNHMMFQELIARSTRLNYLPAFWTRENANANAEVAILISDGQEVFPVEVKSGAKGRLRSLYEYIDRSEQTIAFRVLANRLSIENVTTLNGKSFQLVNVPYYAIGHIKELIQWIKEQ
jgi:predicted AAA+ superfamily ATPase